MWITPKDINSAFFKTWSREMAYVLGYFAADGTMVINRRGSHYIEFHSTDKCLIDMVRKTMCAKQKISVRMPKHGSQHKIAYRLQIGSRAFFLDLERLGFMQRKSNILTLPSVPHQYVGDFVRGYFDGDGCIYFSRLRFAGRKKSRFILMSLFTSGSRTFLHSLHVLLQGRGINGGSLKKKKSGCELVFSFRDSLALYRLMYNTVPDTGLFLPRKYKLFQKAIRTLYPNMRL